MPNTKNDDIKKVQAFNLPVQQKTNLKIKNELNKSTQLHHRSRTIEGLRTDSNFNKTPQAAMAWPASLNADKESIAQETGNFLKDNARY